jgi:hypothetical protein
MSVQMIVVTYVISMNKNTKAQAYSIRQDNHRDTCDTVYGLGLIHQYIMTLQINHASSYLCNF